MDLWCVEAVGIETADRCAYARLVDLFALPRPDRLLRHVARSLGSEYASDRNTGLPFFVADGLLRAVELGEVSDSKREAWPRVAGCLRRCERIQMDSVGYYLTGLLPLWATRGAAATRRGRFLLHVLNFEAGISAFHQHRRAELAGNWKFDPRLSDCENADPACLVDRYCTMTVNEYEVDLRREADLQRERDVEHKAAMARASVRRREADLRRESERETV